MSWEIFCIVQHFNFIQEQTKKIFDDEWRYLTEEVVADNKELLAGATYLLLAFLEESVGMETSWLEWVGMAASAMEAIEALTPSASSSILPPS